MAPPQPTFSIIVPTYNRPGNLSDCLAAIAGQNYPGKLFEVIVVDDGGDKPLEEIIQQFGKQLNLKYLRQINAGPAAARNFGAEAAKGRFLTFTDDDCLPRPDWLQTLADHIDEGNPGMIGGRLVNQSADNPYAGTSQIILDMVYDLYNHDPGASRFFSACNLAVPAELFREAGGFDTRFRISEDREFCSRWLRSGYSLFYARTAVVSHQDNIDSFSGFCRRYFSYGKGAYRYHTLLAGFGIPVMRDEIKFHSNISNWLFYPFRHREIKRPFITALLLVVWQTANALGFVCEAVSTRLQK